MSAARVVATVVGIFAGWPLRRELRGTYVASVVIAVLMVVTSLAGLTRGDAFYGTESPSVLVSQGGDATNLILVLPILLATMWLTRRGSLFGLLLWPGALFYVLYVSAIYLVAAPFTVLMFGYVALVTLSASSVIVILSSIDLEKVGQHLAGTPARGIGGGLVLLAAVAYLGLAATAISALTGAPGDFGFRAQWIVDSALGTPVLLLGGVLLWRRAAVGYATAAGLLLTSGVGGAAFAAAALLDELLTGRGTDPAVIAVHLAVCTVSFGLLALFLRARRPARRPSAGPGSVAH